MRRDSRKEEFTEWKMQWLYPKRCERRDCYVTIWFEEMLKLWMPVEYAEDCHEVSTFCSEECKDVYYEDNYRSFLDSE